MPVVQAPVQVVGFDRGGGPRDNINGAGTHRANGVFIFAGNTSIPLLRFRFTRYGQRIFRLSVTRWCRGIAQRRRSQAFEK